jgi:hypothetical protein
MKKIISLFQRNYESEGAAGRRVRDEVVAGAEWVIKGEGVATRKWDGVAVLIKEGEAFMRFDLKANRNRPDGYIPAQEAPDPVTGHWPGWVPANTPA